MSEQNVRNKQLLYLASLVTVLLIAFFSIVYADSQFLFMVKSIEIQGNHEVPQQEIAAMTDIQRGMNIFDVDIDANALRIRENPYIWNARLSRVFPDRIQIQVYERQPQALLQLDRIYALDRFATLLPKPSEIGDLPIITGIDWSPHGSYGEKVTHPLVRSGLTVIQLSRIKYPLIKEALTEMHWDRDNDSWIAVFNNSKRPLIYCGKENLDDRLNILQNYLAEAEKDNINIKNFQYIDLRYQDQVVVR